MQKLSRVFFPVTIIMVLLIMVGLMASCTVELPENIWSAFHNLNTNSGYSISGGVKHGQVSWTYASQGTGSEGIVYGSPVIRYDRVFVTASNGVIYCLKKNGEFVWAHQTGGKTLTTPAVVNNKIYFGADDGYIYALNKKDGSEKWKMSLGGPIHSSPKIAFGKVFVGCDDGYLYVLDANKGTIKASFKTGGPIYTSPAIRVNRVYFGSDDKCVYGINENKLKTIGMTEQNFVGMSQKDFWKYQTEGPVRSSPAVTSKQVYFGSDDTNIYCLDQSNGTFRWKTPTGGAVESSPALGYSQVFVGSDDGNIYALKDTKDGAQVNWKYPTNGKVRSSPAVASNKVYVVSFDGYLYALDKNKNGTKLIFSPYELGGNIDSSPALASSRLFIGGGKVTCFKD